MKKYILILLALGFMSQFALAQSFDKAKLDQYFDALETNNRFFGSVAVSQHGNIIYSRSLGYADFESGQKANNNSKYRIGSISKTFTAVLIIKAVEEKKLSFDQTIVGYFPNFKNAEKITIEQLLRHRSGIHNFTSDEDYLSWCTTPKTEKEMTDIIAAKGSDFEPDSKEEYSNSNFVLLTYILEKTYMATYADLVQKYIAEPIGLKNTRLGTTIQPQNNECYSYSFSGNWKKEMETDISIPLGAGGIVTTPEDLVKFSDALFAGKLIKMESLEQMKSVKYHYGMGLFPIPFFDKTGYGHTGGIDGFSSVFSHFGSDGLSYAMISNGTNFSNNDISIAVLSAVFNQPYEIPTFTSIQLTDNDLEAYLGEYSSQELPIKISIFIENHLLMAQGTGQSAFPLEATEKDKFKFVAAGIELEFNTIEKTMTLKQGGKDFSFKKDE